MQELLTTLFVTLELDIVVKIIEKKCSEQFWIGTYCYQAYSENEICSEKVEANTSRE